MGKDGAMKGRDALREMLAEGKPKDQGAPLPAARSSSVVKTMSLGLQQLSNEAAAAKTLRASLARAEHVVDISPDNIDASLITDRIPIESDPAFQRLKEQIREHGQQIPILVRPHPEDTKRYQVAYGHRRLRIAANLQRPVKAIVRQLTDAELVIAQGQENNERTGLSFIERALFASRLEKRQFDRETITAALGIDKPELSRLLGVVAAIDTSIILSIGPAPKVGRPRWLALAEKMNGAKAIKVAERVMAAEHFRDSDSNARFNAMLAAFDQRPKKPDEPRRALNTSSGKRVGWLERTRNGLRVVSLEAAFASFLEIRIPGLVQEFEGGFGEPKTINEEERD
jgi:ParB family chromosome partitioning protein